MKKQKTISLSMTFQELMQYPEAVEVLMDKGFHCIGCPASTFETIEQGAASHGVDPKKLIEEINKKLAKKKSKKSSKNNVNKKTKQRKKSKKWH